MPRARRAQVRDLPLYPHRRKRLFERRLELPSQFGNRIDLPLPLAHRPLILPGAERVSAPGTLSPLGRGQGEGEGPLTPNASMMRISTPSVFVRASLSQKRITLYPCPARNAVRSASDPVFSAC